MRSIDFGLRPKLYSVFCLLCLALLFVGMSQIRPVVIEIDDFLGLTSHLPPAYWIGLVVMLAICVAIFLDSKLKHSGIMIVALCILGLFFVGPRVFAEAHPPPPANYWLGAGYRYAIAHQPIDPSSTGAIETYSSWPGYHFINAGVLFITGVGQESLMRYMPIFWVMCCAVIAFATGRRLGLTNNAAFLLSALSLAAFWVTQNYHSPQMFAYILYVLLFMLVVTLWTEPGFSVASTVVFVALVVLHGLTPIAVLLGLTAVALYRRKTRLVWLFGGVLAYWLLFVSPIVFDVGVRGMWKQMAQMEFLTFLRGTGYAASASVSGEIGKYCRAAYPLVLAGLTAVALLFYLTKRIGPEIRRKGEACFIWAVGVTLLLFSAGWSAEVDWRVYMLLLIPLTAIIMMVFSDRYKYVLAAVTCLFVLLHIPADYHTEALQQTLTTELRGAEFFATHTALDGITFYNYGYGVPRYVEFYNPDMLYYRWASIKTEDANVGRVQAATERLLRISDFIISGDRSNIVYQHDFGFNPITRWMESNPTNLIYSNGHYQIIAR